MSGELPLCHHLPLSPRLPPSLCLMVRYTAAVRCSAAARPPPLFTRASLCGTPLLYAATLTPCPSPCCCCPHLPCSQGPHREVHRCCTPRPDPSPPPHVKGCTSMSTLWHSEHAELRAGAAEASLRTNFQNETTASEFTAAGQIPDGIDGFLCLPRVKPPPPDVCCTPSPPT